MKGYFSEKTLNNYARLAAEKLDADFAEGDSYDFTRCIRPDGSTYGTSGKCRKGTEGAAKPGERSPRKFSAAQREEIAKRGAKSAKRLKGSKPAEPPAKKPEKSVADRAMEMVMANARARGLVEIKRSDPAQKPADVQQGPRPAPKGGPMGNYDIPGANAGGMFRRAYND
jgi:hypothetical protein